MDRLSSPTLFTGPSPCDFFLFPTLKETLKRKSFTIVEEVKTTSQEALKNIKLQQFQRCFTEWGKFSTSVLLPTESIFKGVSVFLEI
jgi:hypothetical protein